MKEIKKKKKKKASFTYFLQKPKHTARQNLLKEFLSISFGPRYQFRQGRFFTLREYDALSKAIRRDIFLGSSVKIEKFTSSVKIRTSSGFSSVLQCSTNLTKKFISLGYPFWEAVEHESKYSPSSSLQLTSPQRQKTSSESTFQTADFCNLLLGSLLTYVTIRLRSHLKLLRLLEGGCSPTNFFKDRLIDNVNWPP